MAELKTEKKNKEFADYMQEVAEILVKEPEAMRVVHTMRDFRSTYMHADQSASAKSARKKIQAILQEAWNRGALNYAMISRQLRVSDLDVQALLDSDFQRRVGI